MAEQNTCFCRTPVSRSSDKKRICSPRKGDIWKPRNFEAAQQCVDLSVSTTLTRPPTAAVVVAMAGTMRPAIRFVLKRSAFSMLYMLARRFCNKRTKTSRIPLFLWTIETQIRNSVHQQRHRLSPNTTHGHASGKRAVYSKRMRRLSRATRSQRHLPRRR